MERNRCTGGHVEDSLLLVIFYSSFEKYTVYRKLSLTYDYAGDLKAL